MAKTYRVVTFCAPARRCVGFLAAFAVAEFGSAAQAQFGVPGGMAPFSNPGAAAGALAADCYYQWKGRGGGQVQCPAPAAPAPPKDPAAKDKK